MFYENTEHNTTHAWTIMLQASASQVYTCFLLFQGLRKYCIGSQFGAAVLHTQAPTKKIYPCRIQMPSSGQAWACLSRSIPGPCPCTVLGSSSEHQ